MSLSENELHEQTRRIAEAYYGTAQDPNQIPITAASQQKLRELHPKSVLFKLIHNEPVSWIVVVPTSRALGEKFVSGAITERELFDQTVPSQRYEALYFCSVFTVRGHQRQGYATGLLQEALASIPLQPHPYLFAWLWSREGKALYAALTKKFGQRVQVRTKS